MNFSSVCCSLFEKIPIKASFRAHIFKPVWQMHGQTCRLSRSSVRSVPRLRLPSMHLLRQVASGRAGVNGTKLCVCVFITATHTRGVTGGGGIQCESDTKDGDDDDDDDVPQLLRERPETCSLRIIRWSWQQAVFLDACWSWLGKRKRKKTTKKVGPPDETNRGGVVGRDESKNKPVFQIVLLGWHTSIQHTCCRAAISP